MPDYEIHKVRPVEPSAGGVPSVAAIEVVRVYTGWMAGFFAAIQCRSLNRMIATMDSWPRFQSFPSDYHYAIWGVQEQRYVA